MHSIDYMEHKLKLYKIQYMQYHLRPYYTWYACNKPLLGLHVIQKHNVNENDSNKSN